MSNGLGRNPFPLKLKPPLFVKRIAYGPTLPGGIHSGPPPSTTNMLGSAPVVKVPSVTKDGSEFGWAEGT